MKFIKFVVVILVFFIVSFWLMKKLEINDKSKDFLNNTWQGYKHYFINQVGRVIRPLENDTVSEGQAYAMLRAVFMSDKETFDLCYRWTEKNISRIREKSDNLLAWHWQEGKVTDWMPASDADIDYALSLILAQTRWPNQAPNDLEDYGSKAKKILADILNLETYSTASGRLYLSPWILDPNHNGKFPVNPSYYSPAHFRVFYEFSNDKRWQNLIDTTYYLLDSLEKKFDGKVGKGLIPDWCSVSNNDEFFQLEGKNSEFGWEAVRIPFRIGLDFLWFKSKQAQDFFQSGFLQFIEGEYKRNGKIYCQYSYDGLCNNKYENILFYAAYYIVLDIAKSVYARDILKKIETAIVKDKNGWVYISPKQYYVNSLAWIAQTIDLVINNRLEL